MHMADALLAPAVAATMYVASTATAGVSIAQIKKESKLNLESSENKLPTMAIMSALIFAGQMINFTIPGTGSSGHLCGGFMLSALLGPWAGFLSMIAVLLIQGLFFADGGLMALGANIWNMAFYGCFVGYFLIFKPIMKSNMFSGKDINTANRSKIILASVLGCVLTLQLGAFSVVVETSLSGITELPFGAFCALMQPIHLAIGLVEGLISSAVLIYVYQTRPELIREIPSSDDVVAKTSYKKAAIILVIAIIVIGGGLSLFASGNPDGLEWSLFGNEDGGYSQNMGLDEDDYGVSSNAADKAASIQDKTSFLPDYSFSGSDSAAGTSVSGIVGSALVAVLAGLFCVIGGFKKKKSN